MSESIYFSATHEYVHPQHADHVLIGLDPAIAEKIDEIRYIELMEQGETLSAGDTFATIGTDDGEIELTMPIGGTILSVNEEVVERPQLMCSENYEINWLLELEVSSMDELKTFIASSDAMV